jgi:hypothetical protein
LEYPFLTSPRCPVPSAASSPCETPASTIDGVAAGQSSVVR